jgi:hypothetical protein
MSRLGYEFRTVPLEKVTQLVGGHRDVYIDYWWAVSEDECIYLYGNRPGSPQANRDERITRRLAEGRVVPLPNFKEVRQIPYVSFPHNCGDYL